MSDVKSRYSPEPRRLLYAAEAWSVSAIVLCIIASAAIKPMGAGESAIGYISSAISFAAAMISAVYARRKAGAGGMLDSVVIPLFEIILILSLGYIISNGKLNSGAILSVVSFTIAGYVTGNLAPGRKRAKGRVTVRRHT